MLGLAATPNRQGRGSSSDFRVVFDHTLERRSFTQRGGKITLIMDAQI